VAFRIVDGPEPPRRPPRGRRWVLALAACLLMTGGLAAGASALSGSGDDQTPPKKPRTNVSYTESGVPFVHKGRECKAGESLGHHGKRAGRSSAPRY
jgi:hypothetical protein